MGRPWEASTCALDLEDGSVDQAVDLAAVAAAAVLVLPAAASLFSQSPSLNISSEKDYLVCVYIGTRANSPM